MDKIVPADESMSAKRVRASVSEVSKKSAPSTTTGKTSMLDDTDLLRTTTDKLSLKRIQNQQLIFIAVAVIVIYLITFFIAAMNVTWFNSINKNVFLFNLAALGIVSVIAGILLGYGTWIAYERYKDVRTKNIIIILFSSILLLMLLGTLVFFALRTPSIALIIGIITLAAGIALTYYTYKVNRLAGILLVVMDFLMLYMAFFALNVMISNPGMFVVQ